MRQFVFLISFPLVASLLTAIPASSGHDVCHDPARICSGLVLCYELHGEQGSEPATNGAEIVFRTNGPNIVSNLRGTIATGAVQPDINEHGEIVYVKDAPPNNMGQVFSNLRGQLTFETGAQPASNPEINGLGEVAYTAIGPGGQRQLFSTDRGQLTTLGGNNFQVDREQLGIDDSGRVVFRARTFGGPYNLWEHHPTTGLQQITFFNPPIEPRHVTVAARTGELVYFINDQSPPVNDDQLVSDRDGVIFIGVAVSGLDLGSFPDLGPDGTLVFMGNDGISTFPALTIRPNDNQGGQCSLPFVECLPEPSMTLMLPTSVGMLLALAKLRGVSLIH